MIREAPEPRPRICREGEDVVVLFARTPAPGRVKTRLLTHLTAGEACALHIASTLDTAELLDRASPAAVKWIFWSDPPPSVEVRVSFWPLHLPPSFQTAAQQGSTLGDRMAEAFSLAFASGARRAVIVGSDSPTLPAERVEQAFAALTDYDLVLGPAEDGGYCLIGCRKDEPGLFGGVEWSTPRTLAQTRSNAERLGLRTHELAPWYDLDEWKDVQKLLAEARSGAALPRHLGAFFEQLRKEKGENIPL